MFKKFFIIALTFFVFSLTGCGWFATEEDEPIEPPVPSRHMTDILLRQPETRANFEAARTRIETVELNVIKDDSGVYVIHFPENAVIAFIRSKLEAAGLVFCREETEHFIDLDGWHIFPLNFFDEEISVGVSHISYAVNNTPDFSHGGGSLSNEVSREFATKYDDIVVGVFFSPEERIMTDIDVVLAMGFDPTSEDFCEEEYHANFNPEEFDELHAIMLEERKEAGRQALIQHLSIQAQEFIDILYKRGSLPLPYEHILMDSGIRVLLNGEQIDFLVYPQIIDGRTMVPMREIFEAMGFAVFWEPGFISAHMGGKFIEFPVGSPEMNIIQSGQQTTTELDVPSQIVNGRIFVPLRAIVESTGAIVDWNAEEQLITIFSLSATPEITEPTEE